VAAGRALNGVEGDDLVQPRTVSGHPDLDEPPSRQGLGRRFDLRTFVEQLGSPTTGVLLIVAIVGLLVAGLTAASMQRRDAVYESSQLLLIDQPSALALAPNGDLVAKLASLRVKYTSLLLADAVLEPAAAAVGLPPGAVAGSVRAAAPPESLLIRITARAADPATAPRIAEAVGASLSRYLDEEQAALAVPAVNRITITPLRSAGPAAQVEPSRSRSLSTGAVGGIVAAGLVYLLLSLVPPLGRREGAPGR
jgi:capsular polysaccharide biosynthesis protein